MSGFRAVVGLSLAATGLLSVAPLTAQGAAPRPSRTVTQTYSRPGGAGTVLLAPGSWVPLRGREDRVVVSHSPPVLLEVDFVPAGSEDVVTIRSCDPTLTLAPALGSQVRVEPLIGQCPGHMPSVPTSGSIDLTLSAPAPKPPVQGIAPALRWAALVGIQDYQSPTHDTVGGTHDVAAVRLALLHAGWRSDHILVVTGTDASAAGIRYALSWLADHSTPSTFSLFHYSGHVCIASRGPCGSGHTYLWSQDNRFLSEDAVAAQLRQVRGHAWFDFAGCESGAFDVGLHSASVLFTASSQPGETSYEEPDWKESVWAGLLWERGYDRGDASNGVPHSASIATMTGYAARAAVTETSKQAAGPQHPVVAGGSPRWSLARPL